MVQNVDFDQNIEDRFIKYNSWLSPEQLAATLKRREITQRVSKQVEEEVLTQPQIRVIAYLLGFDDSQYTPAHGPFGISSSKYKRQIEAKIPIDTVVDLSQYGARLKSYGNIAFRRSGIEVAFRELDEKGILEFT